MRTHGIKRAAGAAILLLGVAGGFAFAGEEPQITYTGLEHIWGTLHRLSVVISADRAPITDAEYRVETETGALFPVDGLLDSAEEQVEAYVDLGSGAPVEVRVRAGDTWSEWMVAGEAAGEAPESGCELQTESTGRGGWSKGPVTVDCGALLAAEGGDAVEYSLTFEDWIPASEATFTVDAEGIHWVQVRTSTEDGLTGAPRTFAVALDWTAPTVWMQALPSGELTHADLLDLSFAAEDSGSGVSRMWAEISAEQEVGDGVRLPLWELPLGEHTVTVYAEDYAGNIGVSEQSARFTVTVDLPSLSRLVQLFAVQGRLDSMGRLKSQLLTHLSRAQAALAAGNRTEVNARLASFVELVQEGVADGRIASAAGDLFIADAQWLAGQLEGDLPSEQPQWAP